MKEQSIYLVHLDSPGFLREFELIFMAYSLDNALLKLAEELSSANQQTDTTIIVRRVESIQEGEDIFVKISSKIKDFEKVRSRHGFTVGMEIIKSISIEEFQKTDYWIAINL